MLSSRNILDFFNKIENIKHNFLQQLNFCTVLLQVKVCTVSTETADRCFCVQLMQQMYRECHLVHADLSEYNILWHQGKVRLLPGSPWTSCWKQIDFLQEAARLLKSCWSLILCSVAAGVADRRQSVCGADPPPRPGVPLSRLQECFHGNQKKPNEKTMRGSSLLSGSVQSLYGVFDVFLISSSRRKG